MKDIKRETTKKVILLSDETTQTSEVCATGPCHRVVPVFHGALGGQQGEDVVCLPPLPPSLPPSPGPQGRPREWLCFSLRIGARIRGVSANRNSEFGTGFKPKGNQRPFPSASLK